MSDETPSIDPTTDTEGSRSREALPEDLSTGPREKSAEDLFGGSPEKSDDAETFPREYVEKLRRENAEARTRAKTADDYAQRLHLELVRATGRLADPTDLPFDPAHLEDPEALSAAVDALLDAKPHLKSRRPAGDVGQGATAAASGVDLASLLRANAG